MYLRIKNIYIKKTVKNSSWVYKDSDCLSTLLLNTNIQTLILPISFNKSYYDKP